MAALHVEFGSLRFDLRTASSVRDALAASFVDETYAHGPYVMVGPENDQPAWLWVVDIAEQRSDWWPSLGIALQHAVAAGGDRERVALADLMANRANAAVLVPWVEALAQQWPDAKATRSATNAGAADGFSLRGIVTDAKRHLANTSAADGTVVLDGDGHVRLFPLTGQIDLRDVLLASSQLGDRRNEAPWKWLHAELMYRPWIGPALDQILPVLHDEPEVAAMLDWMFDGRELYRFAPLLASWDASHPPWWNWPADRKPKGWRHAVRRPYGEKGGTFGDVATALLVRARAAAAASPILDLSPLWAPTS